MPNVLLFIPLHPDYGIRPACWQSIQALAWKDELTIVMERLDNPPELGGYQDILRKYQLARQMALQGCYDALLTVEADMVLPALALERLTRVETDVAYGLYCSRRPKHPWLASVDMGEQYANWISSNEQLRKSLWGSVVETMGAGLGCTLIRRHVLETIPFRLQSGGPANDWWFALDVAKAGYSQKHDLGTVCGHVLDESTIVWPDPETVYRKEKVHA